MIAHIDMRPNAVIASLLLAAGVVYLLFLSRNERGGARSARWIPWASLVAGPIIGLIFWSIEVYLANPAHYLLPNDSTALLGAVSLIATFAGCVGSLVFGIALHLRKRSEYSGPRDEATTFRQE